MKNPSNRHEVIEGVMAAREAILMTSVKQIKQLDSRYFHQICLCPAAQMDT